MIQTASGSSFHSHHGLFRTTQIYWSEAPYWSATHRLVEWWTQADLNSKWFKISFFYFFIFYSCLTSIYNRMVMTDFTPFWFKLSPSSRAVGIKMSIEIVSFSVVVDLSSAGDNALEQISSLSSYLRSCRLLLGSM